MSVFAADLVSLLIALAAFAVSIASLYLTSLRRPKVLVEQFHRKPVLRLLDAGDKNDPPRAEAEVPVFVINTGASPTVVSSTTKVSGRGWPETCAVARSSSRISGRPWWLRRTTPGRARGG